jgi:soluble lytic murein transglycosylase-like protein
MKRIQPSIFLGIIGGILCLVGAALFLLSSTIPSNFSFENPTSSECVGNTQIPEKVRNWCEWIIEYSAKKHLDPLMIAAIIQQESGGDPFAISKNGAVGLMQIMPGDGTAMTYQCFNGPCFKDRPSTQQLLDPEYNILYGTELLSGYIEQTGNIRDALRSYGPINMGYEYADRVLELTKGIK